MTPKMEMILQQIVPVYDKQHFCRQPPIFVKSKIIFADRYLTEFIIYVLSNFITYNLLQIIFYKLLKYKFFTLSLKPCILSRLFSLFITRSRSTNRSLLSCLHEWNTYPTHEFLYLIRYIHVTQLMKVYNSMLDPILLIRLQIRALMLLSLSLLSTSDLTMDVVLFIICLTFLSLFNFTL